MTPEPQIDEEKAWAEVLVRWEDEAAHRAFLERCGDLEALARAGARYREVLAVRPGDAVALRWRDEVLRRATAAGLAQLPRTATELPRLPRWVRPLLLAALAAIVLACAVLLYRSMATWGRL
jgi:integrase